MQGAIKAQSPTCCLNLLLGGPLTDKEIRRVTTSLEREEAHQGYSDDHDDTLKQPAQNVRSYESALRSGRCRNHLSPASKRNTRSSRRAFQSIRFDTP